MSDEEGPETAFPGSYPAISAEAATDKARWAVRRQVGQLSQLVRDPAAQRVVNAILAERRAGPEAGGLVQFDALSDPGQPDTLIARGELLLHRDTARLDDVVGFLETQGLARSEVGCAALEDRIVRLVAESLPAQRLDDLARVLRARGAIASVNHLSPLAKPVGKAEGGAEPVAGPGQYPPAGLECAGEGIKVAIIDTGIAGEQRADGWLTSIDRIPPGNDRPNIDRSNIDPLNFFPAGRADQFLDFAAGHGTFAAGVVQQVAPAAEITVYRALDSDGVGTELGVSCAMIRAVADGAQIVNLSLGGKTRQNIPPVAMAAALDRIAELEREQGRQVLLVAAAGNYGDDVPCWPAAFRRVVSVGGLGPDGRPADWSSRGWWLTCSAIGEGVRSTYVEGEESPDADPEPERFPPSAWALWSGTSFAAPQITGAVARIASERGVSVHEALALLLSLGVRTAAHGRALRILPGV